MCVTNLRNFLEISYEIYIEILKNYVNNYVNKKKIFQEEYNEDYLYAKHLFDEGNYHKIC